MTMYALQFTASDLLPKTRVGQHFAPTLSADLVQLISQNFEESEKVWIVSNNHARIGGTVIGVARGKEILYFDGSVCSAAIRYAVLLGRARTEENFSLTDEEQKFHEEKKYEIGCADCNAAWAGYKAMGGI